MTDLVLGPLLRRVGPTEASVWVETDAPCEVEVLGHRCRTFTVRGHHFALVEIRGLDPATAVPYEVALDGRTCWPPPDQPPSLVRTFGADLPVTIAFGSCRRIAPHEPPWTLPVDEAADALGPDALRALAHRLWRGDEPLPDVLVLGGDQVYSDLPSPATTAFIESRRRVEGEHEAETVDFDEFAFAYREAWAEPAVRWLLSTVPTAMIFDDHDVHNAWNSSQDWVELMAAEPGWPERVTAALVAYWVYQHLGNLARDELAVDEVWQAVRSGAGAETALADLAGRAARLRPGPLPRWSFRWDLGPARLVVVDSRSARQLVEGERDMLPEEQWEWVDRELIGGSSHLVVVTSVPVLMPGLVHHLEAWSDAAGAGRQGRVGVAAARIARDRLGLEHWPALPRAFDRLLARLDEVAAGRLGPAPAAVVLLSGEVHYSYLAELVPASAPAAPVVQVVSSPLRNPSKRALRRMHRFSVTKVAAAAGRLLVASVGRGGARRRSRLRGGPWFGNAVSTVRLEPGGASVRFEAPGDGEGEGEDLALVAEHRIGGAAPAAR